MTLWCAIACLTLAVGAPLRQSVDDPEVRAAVERFFAVQEAEDVDGYLALWSSAAPRLQQVQQLRMQLQYIFDSGDDKFSSLTITRVVADGARVRVRVSVLRARTRRLSDGSAVTTSSSDVTSLTYVREGTTLKLMSEGSPADDLADALIAAATPERREALLTAEPDLVTDRLILSLSRRADAAAQSNRVAGALPIYERVLEIAVRLGDRRAQGQALQNVANARYFLHDYAGALVSYELRLTVERDAANDEGIVGALLGIATIKYATFEYSAALASYEEALRLQEKLQDEPGIAVTLLSTGNVRYLQGDLGAAIADYRRSRDAQHALGNAAGEAKSLEGLGRAFTAQGDFAAALEAYGGVLREAAARSDRTGQGNAVQSIGDIHVRLGNLDTARRLFDESRAHFEAIGDLANVGRVWQAAALTDLIAARFAPAEQEYGRSEAACNTAKDRECAARAIVGLAFAQASQGRHDDAIATYGKAIAAFTALRRREEAARAELGLSQALFGKQDYAAALAAAGRVRQWATEGAVGDLVWRAGMTEARALRRLKLPDKSMAAAKEAVAVVQRIARESLDRPGEAVSADGIEAFALLAVLQVEAGDAAAAFDTIELRRAFTLRAALARHERDINRGTTPEERAAEREAATALASLNVQLDHTRSLPQPDPVRVTRLKIAIADAVSARRDREQRLFDRLPDLRIWRGLGPPATVEDLPTWLGESDTVLAQFVIDDDDLAVVTAARSDRGIDVRGYVSPVTRQSLAERIARALTPAVLSSADAWATAAAELLAAIPTEAMTQLAAAPRAVIVPDGVLWRVPFEALPVRGAHPLGGRTVVGYAGSLASLLRSSARTASQNRAPMLEVGAPQMSDGVRDRIRDTTPDWALRAPDQAEAEMQRVAQAAEPAPIVLTGAAATESAFRSAAPASSVLHLAAPFRINSASPLFSLVILGPDAASSSPETDGWLEAREVMNLALAARVVVFSDGGATSMRDAASVAPAVAWAWQAAGVPALIQPRWNADASSSADLLSRLHAEVESGAAPDVALQSAQAAVRAREGMSAPMYWAGWMLVGR